MSLDFFVDQFFYLVDFILHIDVHLQELILTYGLFVYVILFLIVFAETGLVVTPLLPGDSLLFAAGSFAAMGSLDLALLFLIITVAAVLGDAANYTIGKFMGDKLISRSKFIKPEYIQRTHEFYEKHGNKTIVLARFFPIVRTFAPFIAGISRMHYTKFFIYNVTGAVLWITLFLLAGFFFGNIPLVKNNFSIVIISIILISLVPIVLHSYKSYKAKRAD